MLTNIRTALQQIPVQLKTFLLRVLVLFIAWKLLYHLLLFPLKEPDNYLTSLTTDITAGFYELYYPESKITVHEKMDYAVDNEGLRREIIRRDGNFIISIAYACNGLEVFILYIGFLFCIPGVKFKRMLKYCFLGLGIIFVLNIVRVIALGFVFMDNKELFYIAHHYIFKIIIYAVIFYIWMRYVKKSALSYE